MAVLDIFARKPRGGLHVNEIWVDRNTPSDHWIITGFVTKANGNRSVVISPLRDLETEAVYAESYFRRHFMDHLKWLAQENEQRASPSEQDQLEQMVRLRTECRP